jgi:DNA-directed RNA polymerase specialized sigma24 family protein
LADQVIHPSGEAPKANQLPAKPIRRPRFQTRRRLAADQIAALVEAYQSGKTMKELASEFGIHRTTVSSHLNEHGVPVRRGGLDQERAAEAVRLYDEGWSSGRLGERFGVSADTVLTVLRRAGASIRPRRGGPPSLKP